MTPQQRPLLRLRLQGGFIISWQTALEWANHLAFEEKLTKDDMPAIWQFIEGRAAPGGSLFDTWEP